MAPLRLARATALLALLAGCGSPPSGQTVAAATDTLDRVRTDSGVPTDYSLGGLDVGPVAQLDAKDPFAMFGFPQDSVADTTIRRMAVRIVNRGTGSLIVQADAGAGHVTVDTLSGGDSTRVRLETRADSVRLLATDETGAELGSRWFRPDSVEARVAFP